MSVTEGPGETSETSSESPFEGGEVVGRDTYGRGVSGTWDPTPRRSVVLAPSRLLREIRTPPEDVPSGQTTDERP